ncbi:MAG: LON peptidase substrate-binding domain-containing protein, partial [Chloroflexi bacterium]|nr:LON peptidase substrate-binding domain-containing protein [Chloroflexota bacterium]
MSQPQDESPDGLTTLPLFPLNLVLFPGMDLPLHIFEQRYRDMIGECLDKDAPFGVVLIKEGVEVGDPADPERIGTSTRILSSEILDQGRMNILTRGERR